ncbi:limonene-1,2-epoxide hydrolase [Oleiphilus messinensis]|uniref:Limonene-1,2-epoxide hydrolase n=1 Tax=Oleiphilus messinensis TaxID=141451 RepID=A0A1Y0III3_9GAMM|nr:limonene-1,2-epoxide hydrolase family protein [Oleiphilus messinensis]ARU59335.1 limonene-1,2-epoxide hydrolase [Oleiphilus messinensis]
MATIKTPDNFPEKVVSDFLHALEIQDYETAERLLHPDIRYTNVSLPTIKGDKRVGRLIRLALRRGTGFAVQIHEMASNGNVVLTERTDILKVGPLHVGFWVCGRFQVQNGQIIVWRDYFDWMSISKGTLKGLAGTLIPGLRPKLPVELNS